MFRSKEPVRCRKPGPTLASIPTEHLVCTCKSIFEEARLSLNGDLGIRVRLKFQTFVQMFLLLSKSQSSKVFLRIEFHGIVRRSRPQPKNRHLSFSRAASKSYDEIVKTFAFMRSLGAPIALYMRV